jgi:hypothetical protein
MSARPRIEHVYKTMIFDSSRWDGFLARRGDVVVCTGYKAGTTWTQMICALLIHGAPRLPAPLAILSPWIDMRTTAIETIRANLEAQDHRRVVKSHTALDGLPYFDEADYLFCGRDPRDVFMSLQNHMANFDPVNAAAALAAQGVEPAPPPPLPDDLDARFEIWLTTPIFDWEQDGAPYWSHMRHAQTFWEHRHLPNLHFVHYADLTADLEGQMRRIAAALAIEVDEAAWPALVKTATFADMKANAERAAPDVHLGLWKDNRAFFNKGETGQWRGALGEASLRRYDDIMRERYDPTMIDWLERGSRAAGDPKTL